ncbi:MAG: hypothetical protein IAI49_11720, partial [Candidatus Eremiobacteraeota bacterium]|nr:hypothetical protein [Candidatus Eremiobacteraeota bacterium]
SGPATPAGGGAEPERRTTDTVTGEAPWALSAVPECFHQTANFIGSVAFARAHIPAGARLVPGDERLISADCALDVHDGTADLRRGELRLHVPAPVRFFVAGRRLVLDQRAGKREEVRLYLLPSGATPAFSPAPRPRSKP